jgi:hypothetical protein
MAFTSAILQRPIPVGYSGYSFSFGTFDGGAANGGDINTALSKVYFFFAQPYGASQAHSSAVDEVLPLASGVVTIDNGADTDGYWFALGI